MSAVTISYELRPPSGVDTSGLETNKTFTVNIDKGVAGDQKAFYLGLRAAIAEAKTVFGDDLTVWRDLVGKAELTKEPPAKAEEDEDDEEEEEA